MRLSAEQQGATVIGKNAVVNAGAGSGKTTVLTARYLRLILEGGLEPNQIVAITFTKKAACELRERIDEALAGGAQANPVLNRAREQLVSAPIGTIHSFYGRVLHAFPLEAKVNPGFRVLEELESNLLLTKALTATLRQAQTENCPHLAVLIEVLGAEALEVEGGLSRQLRSVYKGLCNRGIYVAEANLSQLYSELPSELQCHESIAALLAEEASLAANLGARDQPEAKEARRVLKKAAEIMLSQPSPKALAKQYAALTRAATLKGGRLKGQKEFIAAGVKIVQNFLSRALAPLLGEAILALLLKLEDSFRREKAAAGGLDFADLQFAMGRLLERPEAAAALANKYSTYLIDEFQDTDLLQHRIIMGLVAEGGVIPPGRLFVVGDEKQSIYRFRGAEIGVFRAVRQHLTAVEPEAEKHISANYRSQKPIIDLVNSLFCQLMKEYVPLQAQRKGEGPGAELIACQRTAGNPAAGEAAAMAARIKEMTGAANGNDPALPAVSFGDIAILIRARTHIKEYEHHLRLAGVPYTVVGGIGFYEQQEVQDLLNLLRAIANGDDELSLLSALRSPLFALCDDSLYALVRQRKQGESLLAQAGGLPAEQQEKYQRAQAIFSELQGAWGVLELPELLELALELTQYREAMLTGHSGLQRYANIEKLLALAEKFTALRFDGDFLAWVEHAAAEDEHEAPVDSETTNAVRIMTIHASKGLQFPVVFLPLVNTKLRYSFGQLLIDEAGGLAFRFPWPCPVWEAVKEQECKRELEEYKRILYVAVTRACDRLALFIAPDQKEEQSYNQWLTEFAEHYPQHFASKQAAPSQGQPRYPLPLPAVGPPQSLSGLPGLQTIGNKLRRPRYFSISQFLLWRQDEEQFRRRYLCRLAGAAELFAPGSDSWRDEPGGAVFGSLLHAAIENINAGGEPTKILESLVPVYFPRADESMGQRVFASAQTLLAEYAACPGPPGAFFGSASEQEFYFRVNEALFIGVIDRLFFAPDHVALVDYKSNHVTAAGVEELTAFYRPQLQFYALAAQAIYQQKIRAYLQFLRLPARRQLVEVPLSAKDEQRLVGELNEFVGYCCG